MNRCSLRHLKLHDLFDDENWNSADAVTGRRLVLANADVRISYAVAGKISPLYRNGVGDECVFVESGQASVETVFGDIDVATGDYVIIPRATTHRWFRRPVNHCVCTPSKPTATSRHRRSIYRAMASCSNTRRTANAICAVLPNHAWSRRTTSRSTSSTVVQVRLVWPVRCTSFPITPSMSWGGMAASIRMHSTSSASTPSPARAPTPARAPGLRGLQLRDLQLRFHARSTTTRYRSQCRTTTPMSTATRSCSTSQATTRLERVRASALVPSLCIRAVTRTGRSLEQSSAAWGQWRWMSRRDGRHLPALVARRRWRHRRRRRVCLELVRTGSGSMTVSEQQTALDAVPAGPLANADVWFGAMFDDAALFPPRRAHATDAVVEHRAWRMSGHRKFVGPLVCSDAQ